MSVARAAKLVLSLVDNVSRPAMRIQNALSGVNRAVATAGAISMAPARAMAAGTRAIRQQASSMTMASGALSLGLYSAAKTGYDMEDVLNEIEGRRFGKRDIFNLADGTEMTAKAWRQSAKELISEINKTSPRHAGEIAKAYSQLVQAGLSHEQVHAILPTSIDFAIAGNYDTEEAADKMTNVMTSMRMPMATMAEAQRSALRTADVISYAANQTNSSVAQMTEAFKYASPSAAALGIDIEQLSAMFLIQAKRGIKASEAGVSIRAMLTRMVRPTKMALESLGRYNIELTDYLERSEEITASDVSNALMFSGLNARNAEGAIQAVLDSSVSTGQKVRDITAAVMKEVGDQSTMSANQISTAVNEILFGFGESLDVERLIADMQAAGIAMSDFFRIFDVRQGARTLALFGEDLSAWVENLRVNSDGFAEVLRKRRMQGIVGAVQVMTASLVDLFIAAGDSGVLSTAAGAISGFAASIVKLTAIDPQILEWGTYAVMATAALAPLGFALTGLGAVAGLVANPISWIGAGLGYLAYLNMDNIIGYVRSFGTAVQESMGPRTANAIGRVKDLMASVFQTHDFDATGAGAQHGNWFANFIESEVVALETTYRQIVDRVSAINNYARNSIDGLRRGWNAFEGWWDNLSASVNAGVSKYISSSMAGINRAIEAVKAKASEFYSAGTDMVQSLWDGAVAKFNEFIAWVREMPGRIRAAFGSVNLRSVVSFGSTGSSNAEALGRTVGGMVPPKVDGARAAGGPVKRGLTYKVGELGEELFTPDENGRIISNQELARSGRGGGRGVVINATFHVAAGAAEDQAMQIFKKLDGLINRGSQIGFDTGKPYGD